jgi:hypothetical protein
VDNALVFSDLEGVTVLDNERVRVERFVVPPGLRLGQHAHPDGQLVVYVRGGLVTDCRERVTIWTDGRVRWFDGSRSSDDAGTNTGSTEIEMVTITLKPVADDASPPQPPVGPLSYPNVAGEDLLENDFVIVQRFVIQPGQWEGVHGHPPNMLFVHIKGGHWAARSFDQPEQPDRRPSRDGDVGWMEPVDVAVGHESGNIGTTPIDFIWVSLKQ